MKTKRTKILHLGDLIAAIYDEAKLYSTDAKEVQSLATETVIHMLKHVRKASEFPCKESDLNVFAS